jgi:flagellin-like protein
MKKRLVKKGISPIIATVLLLGFAVALGTSVFLWQARQTEQLGKGLVRFASGVLNCQEVNFNAQSSDGCTKVSIRNSGFFDVDGFAIRSFSSFGAGSEVKTVFVKAQGSDVLELGLVNAEKVEVMPVVKVEGELVGCKDVVREVRCDGLDELQIVACNTADSKGTCSLLAGSGIVTCQECCNSLGKCCGC